MDLVGKRTGLATCLYGLSSTQLPNQEGMKHIFHERSKSSHFLFLLMATQPSWWNLFSGQLDAGSNIQTQYRYTLRQKHIQTNTKAMHNPPSVFRVQNAHCIWGNNIELQDYPLQCLW